jgi:hypothetical protein
MIKEAINCTFKNKAQQKRFHKRLRGESALTQDAYDAACKALAHWRKEARRLAKIAGVKPREMKHS